MVLTPKFSLSQSDDSVVLTVSVPYVKLSDLELVTDGTDVTFYCKPYLLRITLPHAVVDSDDDRCTATYDYDVNHGTVVCTLP